MQHFAKSLRTLVANNQAKLALAVLNDFLPAQMPHLQDAVLLLQANLTQAERDFTTGVATRSEVQLHLSKVNAGLLNIIGEIASHAGDETEAMARAQQVEAAFREREFVPKSNGTRRSLVWTGGLVATLLAVFLIWRTVKTPERSAKQIKTPLEQVEKPQKSIAEQKTEHDALLKQAMDLSARGQWQKALEAVDKAFGLGFDNAEIFNQRADILLHLARFAESRDDARRAIALDPNHCFSYMSLAQALAKMGDEEGFYSNVETALRKHCKVWKYTQQPGLFEYRNTVRFKKLIRQYQE